MIYPVHHIPGRLRIRSRRTKGDTQAAEALQRRIAAIDGVEKVTVSVLTGSAVIEYACDRVTGLGILGQLDGLRYGAGPGALAVPQAPADAADLGLLAGKLVGAVAQAVVERSALALVSALI